MPAAVIFAKVRVGGRAHAAQHPALPVDEGSGADRGEEGALALRLVDDAVGERGSVQIGRAGETAGEDEHIDPLAGGEQLLPRHGAGDLRAAAFAGRRAGGDPDRADVRADPAEKIERRQRFDIFKTFS